MTEREIADMIADALDYAAVPNFRESKARELFVLGQGDIMLDELEIDSLAAMEICIAIEASAGVSILPNDLIEIGSLVGLVHAVKSRQ